MFWCREVLIVYEVPMDFKNLYMLLRSIYWARSAKNFRGGELLLDGVRGNFFDGGEWPLFIFDGGGISLMLYLHPIKKKPDCEHSKCNT